ncbi:MAG TPA: hypothetical protein VF525_12790 [Pyrinomonadaceae bacterium]|jgi:ElaB/YqjD/DUF883 family membrane-anchored ribosome-binding protein
MAEERYLATARAPEAPEDDADQTKAELQRRMEEARESITQTVSEIKETVTNQYQNVRESITQTLDWREQYRRRPIAFAAGAAGIGLIVGYSVGGALFGDSDLVERYYESEGADYDTSDAGSSASAGSAQPYAGQAASMASYAVPPPPAAYPAASAAASRPSYSSGYEAQSASEEAADDKPGLLDRFKETQAYDRLQQEVGNIGNRVVEELSKTAQTVVLPMLLGKLKDLIGVDLSKQGAGGQHGGQTSQAGSTMPSGVGGTPGATGGAQSSTTGGYGSS